MLEQFCQRRSGCRDVERTRGLALRRAALLWEQPLLRVRVPEARAPAYRRRDRGSFCEPWRGCGLCGGQLVGLLCAVQRGEGAAVAIVLRGLARDGLQRAEELP
jgi:hypothetical protein